MAVDVHTIAGYSAEISDHTGSIASNADDMATLLRDIYDLVVTMASDTTHMRTTNDLQLDVLRQILAK